jgi:hypothetical protein
MGGGCPRMVFRAVAMRSQRFKLFPVRSFFLSLRSHLLRRYPLQRQEPRRCTNGSPWYCRSLPGARRWASSPCFSFSLNGLFSFCLGSFNSPSGSGVEVFTSDIVKLLDRSWLRLLSDEKSIWGDASISAKLQLLEGALTLVQWRGADKSPDPPLGSRLRCFTGLGPGHLSV